MTAFEGRNSLLPNFPRGFCVLGVRSRLLLTLTCLLLAVVPALARVGEPLAEIRKRYGKPQGTPDSRTTFWMFENDFGAMHYTVTVNDKGISIAEGLKPYRRTRFTALDAETFISMQFAGKPEGDRRIVTPGQAYRFGGQDFVCAPLEHVVIDETAGILLIWIKAEPPSVLAVSPEMVQQTK
jgi:hypothetical protein